MKDPGRVLLRRALRVAIVVPICYVVVRYGLDMPVGAPYAVFGSFVLLGFADFGGAMPDRARAYIVTSLIGIAVIVLGTLAAATTVTAVLTTFVLAVIVIYAGVLRGYFAAAGTSVLLPFAIAVSSPMVIDQIPQRCIGFAVAAVISTLAALLLWPAHQRGALRNNLADALIVAAREVHDRWDPSIDTTVDANERMRTVRSKVDAVHASYDGVLSRPGSGTKRDRSIIQLVEELNRLWTAFGWRPDVRRHGGQWDLDLANNSSKILTESADALKGEGQAPDTLCLNEAREQHLVASETWAGEMIQSGNTQAVHASLDDTFQLRMVATFAQFIAFYTRGAMGVRTDARQIGTMAGQPLPMPTSSRTPAELLRSQLTLQSPWFKNALRSGAALAIAVLLAQVLELQHAFWVILGALTALRFDALGTGRTAIQAIVGTVAGFVVGSVLITFLGDQPVVLWILFPILCFLAAYTPGAISLIVGQASFTVLVITLYGLIAPAGIETGEIRVIDVGLGLVVSLVVSALLWPRGIATKVRETLEESVVAGTAFLVAAVDRMTQGPAAAAEATQAAAAAVKSVDVAHEIFDLALASRVPDGLSAESWARMSNVAGHIVQCSDYIVFMAESGRTCNSADVNDQLIAAVHHVRTHMNTAIGELDKLGTKTVSIDVTALDYQPRRDGLNRLHDAVNAYLVELGNTPGPDVGRQTLTAIWMEQWLAHIDWLAERVELALDSVIAPGGT